MFRKRTLIALLLLFSLFIPAQLSIAQGPADFVTKITTDEVMQYVKELSVTIGARPAGSEQESLAADYVAAAFKAWGYEVEIQEFETTAAPESEGAEGKAIISRNVIATRAGDDQIVIVGAHLDSVADGTGAGDNASGVAAIMAAAHALADVPITHTLVFVTFGAEEIGLVGSDKYVESLGDTIENVIAMINVDSVGVGTNLNVYAGAEVSWPEDENAAPTLKGGPTWVRDLALSLADELKLPFGTTPAETWSGFTGDWSDHYAFVLAGVPIVYFEAWQWEGADDPWWGQETPNGDVMHTAEDVYENVVPEKVEMAAELIAVTANALATGSAQPPA